MLTATWTPLWDISPWDLLCLVSQARLDALSRDKCSNAPVAPCFSGNRKLLLLYPLYFVLVHRKGLSQQRGSARNWGIAFCSGVFGVSRYRGYRMRLDRKSRDSGTPSFCGESTVGALAAALLSLVCAPLSLRSCRSSSVNFLDFLARN